MAGGYQEIEITLGEKTYSVRPTFKVISQVEQALGRACRIIGQQLLEGYMSVTDQAQILAIMLKDKGGPKADAIGELLIEDGTLTVLKPLGQFFLDAIQGTKAHERMAKAEASGENFQNRTAG